MCKIEKIVYDISFIRHFVELTLIWHFVAFTPIWHSSQCRRALNPCLLQNASYKTRIIICYYDCSNYIIKILQKRWKYRKLVFGKKKQNTG
jgi:hypothetical protein